MFPPAVASALLLALATQADPPDDPGTAADERRQRLESMRETLAEFELRTDGEAPEPLTLADEPSLYYTNPVRSAEASGATFLWLKGDRPIAAGSLSVRDGGRVFREFSMLADEPVVAERGGDVAWSPRRNGRPFEPIPDAPPPIDSPGLRLTQMRALARRFRVDLMKNKPTEARLLTQPIHRYADPDAGIIDGALFCFAETTDPEALLILEARTDADHPDGRWFYSFARMTSPPVEARLDGEVVWSAPGYWKNPRSKEDPYSEGFLGIYDGDGGSDGEG